MKRNQSLRILAVAVLAGWLSFACDASASDEYYATHQAALTSVTSGESTPLLAGQHIEIGSIEVFVDGDELVLAYSLTDGWQLVETHLWIGESLDDAPQTRRGNPIPGHFPYSSGDITGSSYYEVRVSLDTLGDASDLCDAVFYVLAHAAVQKELLDGGFQTETAWGAGERMVQRGNWATYFTVELGCDEEEPPIEINCETAYAYGDTTFIDLGITNARWGWQIDIDELGDFETPIYAGAAQNDITKGELVGYLIVEYDGELLTVTYELLPGFGLYETHVYAGETPVETVAPGLYGNTHSDLNGALSDTFEIIQSGLPVYLVAHAVVCVESQSITF